MHPVRTRLCFDDVEGLFVPPQVVDFSIFGSIIVDVLPECTATHAGMFLFFVLFPVQLWTTYCKIVGKLAER